MIELRTERLKLRTIAARDTGDFLELAGNWAVARMTSDIPHPLTIDEARRWTMSYDGEVRLAIELGGTMVGAVGYFRDRTGAGELGYWLGQPWWRQGIATEAAAAVVRHAFDVDRLPMLSSSYFLDNPASGRVLAKLGFQTLGTTRIWSEARRATIPAMACRLHAQMPAIVELAPESRVGLLSGFFRRATKPRQQA